MQTVELDGVGSVKIRKSKRAKRVILKIDNTGSPVVVLPYHAPYAIGRSFAVKHQVWFKDNITSQSKQLLKTGDKVGKLHQLKLVIFEGDRAKSSVRNNLVTVKYPPELTSDSPEVQDEAHKASIRALRKEAQSILPTKLHQLAQNYNYSYSSVSVKVMHSRWGSCSSAGVINLSVWLMQLPSELTEYVLCHELAHLNNPHHQPNFWEELSLMIPDYKQRRKSLKAFSPKLIVNCEA